MKKHIISIFAIAALISTTAFAQTEEQKEEKIIKERKEMNDEKDSRGDDKKERKKIIVRKKINGKSENMTIVVDGDKVTINGKPAEDYKGEFEFFKDGKMHIDDMDIEVSDDFAKAFTPELREKMIKKFMPGGNKAFLGVTSEKTDKGAKINEIVKGSAAEKTGNDTSKDRIEAEVEKDLANNEE